MDALTEHFQLKKKLAKSSSPPNPGERINNFVTRLQTLADHCDYNDEKDNQIRDRTLTFIKDKHLKVKLYRDNDLTLGKLLDIVTTYHDKEALVLVPAFEGLLGKLKGFQLKLHIDQSVKPVSQPLRRIPFSCKQKVNEKLGQLEKLGVTEKVENPTS